MVHHLSNQSTNGNPQRRCVAVSMYPKGGEGNERDADLNDDFGYIHVV